MGFQHALPNIGDAQNAPKQRMIRDVAVLEGRVEWQYEKQIAVFDWSTEAKWNVFDHTAVLEHAVANLQVGKHRPHGHRGKDRVGGTLERIVAAFDQLEEAIVVVLVLA